ncbi:MAG: radical SAM protein [Anaerotardibacter sp.]
MENTTFALSENKTLTSKPLANNIEESTENTIKYQACERAAGTPSGKTILDIDPNQEFPIAEIFCSINGEGLHAGLFSTFIRFVGCNLNCSFCDTRWACVKTCPCAMLNMDDLVECINEEGTSYVTLTGGEPLLQPHFLELVEYLVRRTSCFIEIETNGSLNLAELATLRQSLEAEGYKKRIGFTMDWKLPSSGMMRFMKPQNFSYLDRRTDVIKFVAGCEEDLVQAQEVIERYELFSICEVFFSPVFGLIDPAEIVFYLHNNHLRQARVQLQLHKIIWPKVERGV